MDFGDTVLLVALVLVCSKMWGIYWDFRPLLSEPERVKLKRGVILLTTTCAVLTAVSFIVKYML
jgi:hypothetical protein